jgi:hypothetical protein
MQNMSNEVALRPQSAGDRTALIEAAFRVEYATIAWMVIEAAVATIAAIQANSLALLAFGIDSVIELLSAGVLIWRLTVEIRRGQHFAESAEQRAVRVAGVLLFALAAYVVIAAGWRRARVHSPPSLPERSCPCHPQWRKNSIRKLCSRSQRTHEE